MSGPVYLNRTRRPSGPVKINRTRPVVTITSPAADYLLAARAVERRCGVTDGEMLEILRKGAERCERDGRFAEARRLRENIRRRLAQIAAEGRR
jgi:hypothetical protein